MSRFHVNKTLQGKNSSYTIIAQLRTRRDGPWLAMDVHLNLL